MTVLEFQYGWRCRLHIFINYLLEETSFGVINADGVTKRKVEKGAVVDDDCGIIVASDTVLSDGACCRTAITSDLGTAEMVILELLKSDESRAIRLCAWRGSIWSL